MKSRVLTTIAIVTTMLSLIPGEALAQSSGLAEVRATCVRFGCTPAQARQLVAFINGNRAEIDTYAREYRINARAFQAIAIELGLRNIGADPRALLRVIRDRGTDAARYERENAKLRQQLSAIRDTRVRTSAEAVLARADAAYAAGYLETAQAALEELTSLRTSELTTARNAWDAAIQSAISLAAARGERTRLARLVDAADTYLATEQDHNRHQRWNNRIIEATAAFDQGDLRGDNRSLVDSIAIFRDQALPLAPRATAQLDWARTQAALARAMTVLGDREPDTTRLASAVTIYRSALDELSKEQIPLEWARTMFGLADSLQILGRKEQSTERLEEALKTYRLALDYLPRERVPLEWAFAQIDLATTLQVVGQHGYGTERLEEAIAIYRLGLTELPRERVPRIWAMTQSNVANTLQAIGMREAGTNHLQEAVNIYRLAIPEFERQGALPNLATSQMSLASSLTELAQREGNYAMLKEAWILLQSSRSGTRENAPLSDFAQELSQRILTLAQKRGWTLPTLAAE
jgi:hypothetical protein